MVSLCVAHNIDEGMKHDLYATVRTRTMTGPFKLHDERLLRIYVPNYKLFICICSCQFGAGGGVDCRGYLI